MRKKIVRRFLKLIGAGIIFGLFAVRVSAGEIHESGLQTGKGLDLVLGNCTVCHSADIIVNNHMSRPDWNRTITWMQEEQGLWELAPEDRNLILDYLADHQGMNEADRRERKNRMYQYDYRPNPLYNY